MLNVTRNDNYEISASAKMFVVPNRAGTIEELSGSTRKKAERDSQNNGVILENCDKFIECWITSQEDLNTTNLADHGFGVYLDDDSSLLVYGGAVCCRIPSKVFDGKKEGDIISWVFECEGYLDKNGNTNKIETIRLHLEIELNQMASRYSRFGQFEEVVKTVTA